MNFCRFVLKSLVAALALLPPIVCRSSEPATPEKPLSRPMIGQQAGQVRDDNGLKTKLIWCPPGKFIMEDLRVTYEPAPPEDEAVEADPEEEPAPRKDRRVEERRPIDVVLSRGFWLGKCEVTQAEWKSVMETEPWQGTSFTESGPDFPATSVSWNDAVEFCNKLTEQERQAGRLTDEWEYSLPTDAQWDRACRAETTTRFSFGDDESQLRQHAWMFDNTFRATEHYPHSVGRKKPNPWGLCDMHGNVFEWCRDLFSEKLPGGRDPEVTTGGVLRVARGGGWNSDAANCTSAARTSGSADRQSPTVGFRLALTPFPLASNPGSAATLPIAQNLPVEPVAKKAGPALSEEVLRELDRPTSVDFLDLPLTDAIQYVSDIHKIAIRPDKKGLEQARISLEATTTPMRLVGVPLRSVLTLILRPAKLGCIADAEGLVITTAEKAAADPNLVKPQAGLRFVLIEIPDARGFAAAVEAEDEVVPDDLPDRPVAKAAKVRFSNEAFTRLIFGDYSGPLNAQDRLDELLERKLAATNTAYGLTEAQKQKLQLAGRADIQRWFDRVGRLRANYERVTDKSQASELALDVVPLHFQLQEGPFGEISLFAKVLRNSLTPDPVKKKDSSPGR